MCEVLPPFGECGVGVCVNGSCVCNKGFSQNVEFYYGELPQIGVVSFCDYDAKLMQAMAGVLLALTLCSVVLQLRILQRWNQARRVLPVFTGYVALVVVLIWRMVDIESSLFGYDVGYTSLLTTGIVQLNLQQVIYLNKFVHYTVKVFRFKKFTRKITNVIVRLQHLLTVLVMLAVICIWATSVVDNQVTSGQLIAAANAIFVGAHGGFILSGYTLFTKSISDLKRVTRSPGSGAQRDTAFIRKCQQTIPRMRFVRETLCVSNLWNIMANMLALVFTGWLKIWVYLIFIHFFAFEVSSLVVILSSGKAKLRRSMSKLATTGSSFRETTPTPNNESLSKEL